MSFGLHDWVRTWHELGALAGDEGLHRRLCERWSEPHRHYHTLQHLRQCLRLLEEVRELAQRPAEVAVALWFHDAIYDPRATDNEALSAEWARRSVLDAGLPSAVAGRVHAMVIATAHEASDCSGDACLVVDIDLAILGALPDRFDAYDRDIRREYAHVPEPQWKHGRARVLESFLARDALYATATFRASLEARGRDNLRRALGRLAPFAREPT